MREFKIACAGHRKAKTWKNVSTTWPDLRVRLCATTYTTETQAEYWAMSKDDRDAAKDKGSFVGGYLNKGCRKAENVVCRSLITLDGDKLEPDFIDSFRERCRFAAVLYTTHSHTAEAPRARIVIPLEEDIPPDRYAAVSRFIAAEFGIDQFDPCSYTVNQLMHWPTTSRGAQFISVDVDKPFLNAETFLAEHPGWENYANLPTSIRKSH